MIGLFDELGLGDRLQWGRPPTAVLRDGQIRRLDGPLEVLTFTPLSPLARVRLGAGVALLKAAPDPERFEGQTAARWLRAGWAARRTRSIWEPQLRGKFGAEAERIGMPWFWARIHDRTHPARVPARRLPAALRGAGRRPASGGAAASRLAAPIERHRAPRRQGRAHHPDGAPSRSTPSSARCRRASSCAWPGICRTSTSRGSPQAGAHYLGPLPDPGA